MLFTKYAIPSGGGESILENDGGWFRGGLKWPKSTWCNLSTIPKNRCYEKGTESIDDFKELHVSSFTPPLPVINRTWAKRNRYRSVSRWIWKRNLHLITTHDSDFIWPRANFTHGFFCIRRTCLSLTFCAINRRWSSS